MITEHTNTLIVGGGQAGLAVSEHLNNNKVDHIILERHRIVERWRTLTGPIPEDIFRSIWYFDFSNNPVLQNDIYYNLQIEKTLRLHFLLAF